MAELVRVHCEHCGQTYFSVEGLEECDLCRKPGRLLFGDAALVHARRDHVRQNQPTGNYPVSSNCDLPAKPRSFSRVDAKRGFIAVPILIVTAVCYWFLLPAIQSLILPSALGGKDGPWVVRPILAFHFGAVVVMAAVTLPLVMRPIQRAWMRHDAVLGTRYDPFHGRPAARILLLGKGSLLLIVYASGLVFYLFSWDVIGPDGIVERLPWATLKYSFEDVRALETIPDGERSDSISKDGPWYSIKLKSGRSIDISEDNEGMTRDELQAMIKFISNHTRLTWVRRKDARPHQGGHE